MKSIFLKNLANLITAIGVILAVWTNALIWGGSTNHLLIFLLASAVAFSDLLDGWLARRRNIISSIGASLDKFRDKIFICPLFVYFLKRIWQEGGDWLALIKGLILLILLLEFFLILVWVVGFIKGLNVASHWAGKVKMDLYFAAAGWWLFLRLENSISSQLKAYLHLGLVPLFSFAAVFAIFSLAGYLQRYSGVGNHPDLPTLGESK